MNLDLFKLYGLDLRNNHFLFFILLTASTHDQDVFSFYPEDDRHCNGFEEVLSRYREIVPHLRLAGLKFTYHWAISCYCSANSICSLFCYTCFSIFAFLQDQHHLLPLLKWLWQLLSKAVVNIMFWLLLLMDRYICNVACTWNVKSVES